MSDITIISCIDNNMGELVWGLCRDYLVWSAGDIPIISISQKPVELGTNICIGEIGRSMASIFTQVLAGAMAADTEYVALADQDVLYPKGYFEYVPPRDDTFYYNLNELVLHYTGNLCGCFATLNGFRAAFSQIICSRRLLVSSVKWVVRKLDEGYKVNYKEGLLIEPGLWKNLFVDIESKHKKYGFFWSEWPAIDLRHNKNFTKQERAYSALSDAVIYWGTPEDIVNKKPMKEPCLELEL